MLVKKKKKKFLCEKSDARKVFEFLTHRLPVITANSSSGPSSAHRPLEGKAERSSESAGGTVAASEPLLSRPRYRSRLISTRLATTKSSGPRASLRNSHYYSPWNSSTRGDAMGRGSRCTGATDRSLPSLGKAFSSFMASSSSCVVFFVLLSLSL